MNMRPKIVKLARMIGGVPGLLNKITVDSPEYYCLDCVVTDEQADVALVCGLRKPRTIAYLAKKCGKTYEETERLAHELADSGVFTIWRDREDGLERCYVEIFAPGTLERMVGNREQLEKHPIIGKAFNEYTANTAAHLASTLPMGSSLMRVFPIESAIEGNTQAVPYERLSYYLDKFDVYSVSDCSCRASRRIIGEGCGHLEEDMCLHLGPAAEYYAETGKAHYITRQEAEDLLRRAEENGLMHCLPNINKPGESDSICNCCGCSCFGLRVGLMFGARDAVRSNFIAKIDEEACVACGQCVEVCPGNALKMGQRLHTKTPLSPEPRYKKVNKDKWTEADWNINYRENREDTVASGTAPCKVACPAHIAVQGYLRLAAEGKYKDALALIKRENPFPAVCGRICNHRCETECTRGNIDEAVAIDEVKRFIADYDLKAETRYVPPMRNPQGRPYDEKIAIIGAGPAGMSCAFFLAERGYRPTVFDKASRPGGMMMNAIPGFRLEKDVVQAEIDILKEMGVEFRCGIEVGKDITIDDLRREGYKGFYVAIGAQGSRALGIAGETAEGVYSGIHLMSELNQGKTMSLSGRSLVIGGGNVAVDVARTALRVGDGSVRMACLEERENMPAAADEVIQAEDEGMGLLTGWGPKEILTDEAGRVRGVTLIKCVRTLDEKGRFSPLYDESQSLHIECENVLVAVGQTILLDELLQGTGVESNPDGTIKADPFTYQTAEPDIFVGGDVFTGPSFVIDAIAAGKEGAISLHRQVHEGQSLTLGRDRRVHRALDRDNTLISTGSFDSGARQVPGYNAAKAKSFGDTRVTFTEEQLRCETARCLSCGSTKVDEYLCIGCGQCTTKCNFDAIRLEKKYDVFGMDFEKLPFAVAKHVVKRGVCIATKPLRGER